MTAIATKTHADSSNSSWNKTKAIGRGLVMLANAGILAAPALAAINGANKNEWSELVSDAAAHITTLVTIGDKRWVVPSVIVNVSRMAILGFSLSTFPTGAQYFDFGLHTVNVLSAALLR